MDQKEGMNRTDGLQRETNP